MDSLAMQADPGIEVLVIDTSDSDATLAIVATYADRLALRVLEPDHVAGCSAKMNYGVDQARADHVSWLCQDDLWLPGRTAAVRRWLAEDPAAALHLAPSAIVDAEGRTLGIWNCPLRTATAGSIRLRSSNCWSSRTSCRWSVPWCAAMRGWRAGASISTSGIAATGTCG
jgi:glycosyltransferase involved in cell wall biosynthesis